MVKIHLIEAINEDNSEDLHFNNFGLRYLMAYAEKYGKYDKIKKYKCSDKFDFKEIPDIVGISSVTRNFEIAKKIAKKIKSKSSKTVIIFGGVHVSLLPLSAPKEADYVVVGEGEETFLELLDYLTKKKSKIEKIKGVFFWKDDQRIFTGPREYMRDLDKIPFVKRDEFDMTNDWTIMLTSRGCPYTCAFCPSVKLWKNTRYHSAKYVIDELNVLVEKYHAKNISFVDDLCVVNRTRLNEIVEEIEKRGWNKKVNFGVNARANLVNQGLIDLLKRMNVIQVGLGLETGSPKMLKIIKQNTVTMEQNYTAVRLLQKNGIDVNGSFMLGYPGETEEDIKQTFEFIEKSNIAYGGTQITQPYPGTELWDYALKKGIVSENMDWGLFQVDFGTDINRAIIISDLDRELLAKYYAKFVETWLYRSAKRDPSLSGYLRKLNLGYVKKLIKDPKKILLMLKFGFNIIKNKFRLK